MANWLQSGGLLTMASISDTHTVTQALAARNGKSAYALGGMSLVGSLLLPQISSRRSTSNGQF